MDTVPDLEVELALAHMVEAVNLVLRAADAQGPEAEQLDVIRGLRAARDYAVDVITRQLPEAAVWWFTVVPPHSGFGDTAPMRRAASVDVQNGERRYVLAIHSGPIEDEVRYVPLAGGAA